MEKMIVAPITKTMEIIMNIQVCLISWMAVNYKESGRKKSFLANPEHQYRVSQCEEHSCSANNKKNGDCNEYPSLSHFKSEL